jgi:hypothetical protein
MLTMHTTNYRDTFIHVSPDCPVDHAIVPSRPGTIASLQYERIKAAPYTLTSDDLIFGIFADRSSVPDREREAARAAYFSKGQPCLRSSPLVKTFGWGVHHDSEGRIAIYGLGEENYALLAEREDLDQIDGMRSSRR